MTFWEFLSTRNAGDIIRLIEGVVGIVAAVLSGAALRNVIGLRKMIGGPLQRTVGQVVRSWFHTPKHNRVTLVKGLQPPDEGLPLDQRVDLLQQTLERLWTNQGQQITDIRKRVDKMDPPPLVPPTGRRRKDDD